MKALFAVVMFLIGGAMLLFGGGAVVASHYGDVPAGGGWWVKVIGLMAGGTGLMAMPHARQIMDALAAFVNNHATNVRVDPLPAVVDPAVPPAPAPGPAVKPLGLPNINGLVTPTKGQADLQQFVQWEVAVLTHLIQAYDGHPELKTAAVNLLTTSINTHFLPKEGVAHEHGT